MMQHVKLVGLYADTADLRHMELTHCWHQEHIAAHRCGQVGHRGVEYILVT